MAKQHWNNRPSVVLWWNGNEYIPCQVISTSKGTIRIRIAEGNFVGRTIEIANSSLNPANMVLM